MARGRYQDPRRRTFAGHERSPSRRVRARRTPDRAPKDAPEPTESWTKAQLDRALSMHFTGQRSDREIASRLGLREQTVAKMIAAGYAARAR